MPRRRLSTSGTTWQPGHGRFQLRQCDFTLPAHCLHPRSLLGR